MPNNKCKINKEVDDLLFNRISRIEGQLKGVKKMIEEKKECLNVVTQVTAIREAVNMLGVELLKADLCGGKKNIDEKYLKTLFKIN